jgi:hypothetical protein
MVGNHLKFEIGQTGVLRSIFTSTVRSETAKTVLRRYDTVSVGSIQTYVSGFISKVLKKQYQADFCLDALG